MHAEAQISKIGAALQDTSPKFLNYACGVCSSTAGVPSFSAPQASSAAGKRRYAAQPSFSTRADGSVPPQAAGGEAAAAPAMFQVPGAAGPAGGNFFVPGGNPTVGI